MENQWEFWICGIQKATYEKRPQKQKLPTEVLTHDSESTEKNVEKNKWTSGGSNAGLFASDVVMQSEHSTTELHAQFC